MTPAIKALEKAKVGHRVLAYDHDPAAESFGLEAAEALGLDPDVVYKTLVAVAGASHVVAVVPVTTTLDLKALAAATGAKKAAMAEVADAERITGYVHGGISPIGQRKRLPTFVDASADSHDLIYVSAGRRGLDVELAPADLIAITGGMLAPIATTG